METTFRNGMLHTKYQGKEVMEEVEVDDYDDDGVPCKKIVEVPKYLSTVCKDEKCGRPILHEQVCFIDSWSDEGDAYCDSCGKCIRYARKKAKQRGELQGQNH